MISYSNYPGLFVFQIVFTLLFTALILWQAWESIKVLNK